MNDVQDIAQYLAQEAEAIRNLNNGLYKEACKVYLETGRRLIGVKDTVGHGGFLPWIRREFGWSERTAQKRMQAYREYGSNAEFPLENFSIEALLKLSSPSTPNPVKEEWIEKAKAGKKIGKTEIREAIDNEKSNPPPAAALGVKEEQSEPDQSGEVKTAGRAVFTLDETEAVVETGKSAGPDDLGVKRERSAPAVFTLDEPEVKDTETKSAPGADLGVKEERQEPQEIKEPAVIPPKRRPVFVLDEPEETQLKDITPPPIFTLPSPKVETEIEPKKEPEVLEASPRNGGQLKIAEEKLEREIKELEHSIKENDELVKSLEREYLEKGKRLSEAKELGAELKRKLVSKRKWVQGTVLN